MNLKDMINYIKIHKFETFVVAVVALVTIVGIMNLQETRDEKIESCFDKPSDKGVEFCLQWLASKEETTKRELIKP